MSRFHPIGMIWHDLAFIHWPFPADAVRRLLPEGLELDTYEGQAWIGIVPFYMTGVGYPLLRNLGIFSRFLEINVRTYVKKDGRPGIWFFSLDAASRFAVRYCRTVYRLPYYFAEMSLEREAGDRIRYGSARRDRGDTSARFEGSYRPVGEVYQSRPGDLDHWLSERYSLFAEGSRKRILRCDIRHRHWPLQKAEAEIRENTMLAPLRLEVPPPPPLVHFAKRLSVKATHLF